MVLLTGGYAAVASYYVLNGQVNADEDFYALAAMKATSGEVPYRDFAYSQMPALPYINGLAMRVAGFGLVNQRSVNALWGALTLIVAMVLGFRTGGWPVLAACGCVFALSPAWIYFTCLGKTYALAGFFLILAAASLYLKPQGLARVILCSIAGALAIGCRLTVAPAVAVFWTAQILHARTIKTRCLAVALPLAITCCLYAPFFLASPENFLFWNFQYHAASTLDAPLGFIVKDNFWLAPGVLMLLVSGVVAAVAAGRKASARGCVLMLAAVVGFVAQLCMKVPYGENSTPLLGLAIVGAVEAIAATRLARWLLPASIVAAGLALLGPLPPVHRGIHQHLDEAARFVQSHTQPTDTVLTPFPLVAIQAQRATTPRAEMAKFCLTTEMDEERARRLHLLTPQTMRALIEAREPAAICVTSFPSPWNFYWTVPSLKQAAPGVMRPIFDAIIREYEVGLENEFFTVLIRRAG